MRGAKECRSPPPMYKKIGNETDDDRELNQAAPGQESAGKGSEAGGQKTRRYSQR